MRIPSKKSISVTVSLRLFVPCRSEPSQSFTFSKYLTKHQWHTRHAKLYSKLFACDGHYTAAHDMIDVIDCPGPFTVAQDLQFQFHVLVISQLTRITAT
jgi:hypothetical protein